MDYLDKAEIRRFPSFTSFENERHLEGRRLVLLTTRGAEVHHRVAFRADDILLAGRESAGVPDEVHDAADIRVRLPMAEGMRSLNVVTAISMVLGEALRQTDGFPKGDLDASADDHTD